MIYSFINHVWIRFYITHAAACTRNLWPQNKEYSFIITISTRMTSLLNRRSTLGPFEFPSEGPGDVSEGWGHIWRDQVYLNLAQGHADSPNPSQSVPIPLNCLMNIHLNLETSPSLSEQSRRDRVFNACVVVLCTGFARSRHPKFLRHSICLNYPLFY